MSLVAMAFLWTGSQIPVYLFGKSNHCLFLISRSLAQVVFLLISMVISVDRIDGYGSFSQIFLLLRLCAPSSVLYRIYWVDDMWLSWELDSSLLE